MRLRLSTNTLKLKLNLYPILVGYLSMFFLSKGFKLSDY